MASKLPTEDVEVADLYILERQRYNISNAEEAPEALARAIDEVKIEGTEKATLINRLVERIQILSLRHHKERIKVKGEG